MALLEIRGLTKRFGGLTAVDSLDFDVIQGEILGLIGPNGAGKTTLFNLISGVLQPTQGKIFFKGRNITGLKTHKRAAKGIVRTFQSDNLFPDMTVLENVVLAHHLYSKTSFWGALFNLSTARKDRQDVRQKSLTILDYAGLSSLKNELAKNLSHGHQRSLGVALALAASQEVLLLDEPLTGMNSGEVTAMLDLIRDIRKNGRTLVLVEHNMRAIMSLCDRIVAINFGKKMAEGLPNEIQNNQDVIDAYLGAGEVM
jgi:branched-chain amino acid transport system ATP-binding protein